MSLTLKSFATQCHDFLTADPGPAGREKVRDLLREALRDKTFLAETVGPERNKSRDILYEDADLGFCILSHVNSGAAKSKPHDHGPSWAIYGQADGVTEMTDWEYVEKPAGDQPGKVKAKAVYKMTPGDAYLYNEGALHSPSRENATRLVRIEGKNMEGVKRVWHVPV